MDIKTLKQYLQANMKHQNDAWKTHAENIYSVFFTHTKNELYQLRLLRSMCNCYVKIWMYIASESFAKGKDFDGLIDNLFPLDVANMVDLNFELNPNKKITSRLKMFIGFEIYNGLFPTESMFDYQDHIGYGIKPTQ